jgi:carbon monoxide dehydrogenase subunit G
MQFENTFTIPVAPDEAWPLLLDVPAIAPCLPGAEITEVLGGRKYRGRATVKVGPVQLAFAGEAEIVDIDEATRTARVVACGADQKGRGNASASVTFSLVPEATGSRVNVVTDLTLVGAVAQYGRGAGLLRLVADQIIGQFARTLEAALRAASDKGDAGVSVSAQPISGLRVMGGAIGAAIRNKWAAKQT